MFTALKELLKQPELEGPRFYRASNNGEVSWKFASALLAKAENLGFVHTEGCWGPVEEPVKILVVSGHLGGSVG